MLHFLPLIVLPSQINGSPEKTVEYLTGVMGIIAASAYINKMAYVQGHDCVWGQWMAAKEIIQPRYVEFCDKYGMK